MAAVSPRQVILAQIGGVPLHAVLQGELVELSLGTSGALGVGKKRDICWGTNVFLAPCLHARCQAAASGG